MHVNSSIAFDCKRKEMSEELSEYERRRLENIARNEQEMRNIGLNAARDVPAQKKR